MAKANASGKVDRLTIPGILGRAVNTSIFDVMGVDGKVVKDEKGGNRTLSEVVLFRVGGTLRQLKHGHGDKGPWTQLIGDFGAVNAKGERMLSDKLFLPDAGTNLLVAALKESKVASVDFVFEVIAKRDKTVGGAGYIYLIKPIVKPTDSEGLAKLFDTHLVLPAVAAPAKAK